MYPYAYIGFMQWEVKQLEAFGDQANLYGGNEMVEAIGSRIESVGWLVGQSVIKLHLHAPIRALVDDRSITIN